MRENESGGGTVLDLQAIAVDLNGLHEFAQLLDGELAANLRPYAAGVIQDHEGRGFVQTSGSLPLWTAVRRYEECLGQAALSLRRAVAESEVLITVVRQVLSRYGDSDALSADRLRAVQAALTEAGAAANAELARLDAEQMARRQRADSAETFREDHGRGRPSAAEASPNPA